MATPRVGNTHPQRQYRSVSGRNIHRESCLALNRAIYGLSPRVAKAVGRTERQVRFWIEPQYEERWNPLERVAVVILEALDAGKDEPDALAPFHLLCDLLGRDSIPRPGAEPLIDSGIRRATSSVIELLRTAARCADAGLACVDDNSPGGARVTEDEWAEFEAVYHTTLDALQRVHQRLAQVRNNTAERIGR